MNEQIYEVLKERLHRCNDATYDATKKLMECKDSEEEMYKVVVNLQDNLIKILNGGERNV